MSHTTLISTDELAAHLKGARPTEGAWAVVDCRANLSDAGWGRAEYQTAHIPGAVFADLNDDLAGPRTGTNGRHPLPSVASLAATFARLGISNDVQVVVYDQDTGLFASRLWWSLRYLGHDAVALLDGGWAKWIREGHPTAAGIETPQPATFTPAARPGSQVNVGEVAARVAAGGALLVDARGPERFEGREETVDPIAGHIPGAVNHFYKWNLSPDGTMLPAEELRRTFETLLGTETADRAVMYCGSGVSACHNLLAMEHAGLSGTPLYVGSWSEWSSDPKRGVETGQGPKGKGQR